MSTILGLLQHALGRDQHGRGTDYRNHLCIGAGSPDFVLCREATAQGLLVDHGPQAMWAGDHCFTVTDAGKAYIAKHSPPEPKRTRGQERYQRWLDVSDVTGESFGQYLRRQGRKERDVLRDAEDRFAAAWQGAKGGAP